MNGDNLKQLQELLKRLAAGDDAACPQIMERAYDLLCARTRRILHDDFAGLRNAHATNSVLHRAYPGLADALKEVRPPNVAALLGLVSRRVCWTLLELARRRPAPANRGQDDTPVSLNEVEDRAAEEADDLAVWAEFHQQAEKLPEDERAVFRLSWYGGLRGAEIARQLGRSEKEVSRLLIKARLLLAPHLPDGADDLVKRGVP